MICKVQIRGGDNGDNMNRGLSTYGEIEVNNTDMMCE